MTAPVLTREEAAVQAAAMIAAAKAPKSPLDVVEQTMKSAAVAAEQASSSASASITSLWRVTDPYDWEAVGRFLARAGRVIVAAQNAVASTAASAQLAQMRAIGVDTRRIVVKIPDNVRGASVHLGGETPEIVRKPRVTLKYDEPDSESRATVTVRGSDSEPDTVFNRAVVSYRYQRSEGATEQQAQAAAEERIASTVDGNLQLAKRLGEQQALVEVNRIEPRVTHWRRVFHPELSVGGVCGLCVAAADRTYTVDTLMPIHARCKCTVAAVLDGADFGYQLNQDDLERLYDASGGTDRASLKRTRFSVVQHSELGPVLTRVQGEQVPYYSTEPPTPSKRRKGTAAKPAPRKSKETEQQIAARHLPTLQATLERIRAQGMAEDSPAVQYNLRQIAKFEAVLKKSA